MNKPFGKIAIYCLIGGVLMAGVFSLARGPSDKFSNGLGNNRGYPLIYYYGDTTVSIQKACGSDNPAAGMCLPSYEDTTLPKALKPINIVINIVLFSALLFFVVIPKLYIKNSLYVYLFWGAVVVFGCLLFALSLAHNAPEFFTNRRI